MTQVNVNGKTYSDDGTTAKDMRNMGHATHFLPMVGDAMAEMATRKAECLAAEAGAEAAEASALAAQTAAELAQQAIEGQAGGAVSLTPGPSKIPLTGPDGRLDPRWLSAINDIGTPGAPGFGVGICPAVPAGWAPMSGVTDPPAAGYGGYITPDGSHMRWRPAHWRRIGHPDNPTYAAYGVNSVDIQPYTRFPDEATAAAEGYYLPRSFRNAGAIQLGYFVDQVQCSNNGGVASAVPGAMPVVTAAATGNSVISALNGGPSANYAGTIAAAKTRGPRFFPATVWMYADAAYIAMAHAQASTSATWCAWYSGTTTNYPKGNNNNALKDINDTTVTYTGAGASGTPNLALAGSGTPYAKTTDNGQACGVADINGNIWEVALGLTCIAAGKSITGVTLANPLRLTIASHGYTTGNICMITAVGGTTQINDDLYTLTVVDPNTISLDGVDGTAFGAYTSGGLCTVGTFYTLNDSVDIAAVTSGTTLSTDHWGATGVAAQFSAISPAFATTYPNNGFAQRYGNGANAVLSQSSAANRALANAGLPIAAGMSAAGSNLFGGDYYYQYIRDALCVLAGGNWNDGSNAGVWMRRLNHTRSNANDTVGFRAASYL
jgi:hypothetical protein